MSPAPFRLTRYFTLTSLAAIATLATTLVYLEGRQTDFFAGVQARGAQAVSAIQSDFARRADESARQDLIAAQEQGHVNLTQLLSNALWRELVDPYLLETQRLDVARCRPLPDVTDPSTGKTVPGPEKTTCLAELGLALQQLPSFRALDQRMREAMAQTSMAKIKVYSLDGIVRYTTDFTQLGEDKAQSASFQSARQGKAASELSFRERFRSVHGDQVNRNLFSSYLPVRAPGTEEIVGVIELYSDVTPMVTQVKASAARFQTVAADNERQLAEQAAQDQAEVRLSGQRQLMILVGLLVLLYLVLLVVVRRAQGVIERQASDAEAAKQRLVQSEKMNALGQMVAGVAHQLNTPLAFSRSNVQMVSDALQELDRVVDAELRRKLDRNPGLQLAAEEVKESQAMLADVFKGLDQMNELVDNLRSFSRLDRSPTHQVSLSKMLQSVCYIARTVIPSKIVLEEHYDSVPPITCNVSELNQVFLNLLMNAAQAMGDTGHIRVEAHAAGELVEVAISDTGPGIAPAILPKIFEPYFTTKPAGQGTGLGLSIARGLVRDHGGDITVRSTPGQGATFVVSLPLNDEGSSA
jgi:signal transduction histidine kinase